MAYCENCGHQISDQAVACPNCGHPGPALQASAGPIGAGLAEWWKRAVAIVVDSVLLSIPTTILNNALAVEARTLRGATGLPLRNIGISALVGVAYYTFLNGSDRGQTVGKMLMKIRVRDEETGGSIGYGRALLRWVVYLALWIACVIPGVVNVLRPLWDPRRQTWHDKAARSIVVDAP